LGRLAGLFADGAPRTLFVNGLAGCGKSALLHEFAIRARGHRRVVILDCRGAEPTEEGFFSALAIAAGIDLGDDDSATASRIARLAHLAERVVICLDQYEVFRLLDTWLRQVLASSLPDNVRLVLCGRERAHPAWSRQPAGAFEMLLVGPLNRGESQELLRALGVNEAHVPSITRFAGGHPLTLLWLPWQRRSSRVCPCRMSRWEGCSTSSPLLTSMTSTAKPRI
jgi:hypothetical protein